MRESLAQLYEALGARDLVEIAILALAIYMFLRFLGKTRGAGIVQSAWAADEGDFEGLIDLALDEDGPWLIGCRIDQSGPAHTTERDPARIRTPARQNSMRPSRKPGHSVSSRLEGSSGSGACITSTIS